MDATYVLWLLTIVILLILSGFFSASETAFSSLNKNRLKTIADKGSRTAKIAVKLEESYDELLTTILIGNNIVNIALASVGTMLLVHHFGDKGASISVLVITILVLIFGEVMPKCIAKDCPENIAMFSAPLLWLLMWIFKPACIFFAKLKQLLSKVFHFKSNDKISQEELLMLVDEVREEGSLNKNEGELLRNVIEFSERTARDILTPRVKLGSIPVNASKDAIAKAFSETKFSRLLVFQGTIDNIIGVIHLKNFYENGGITDKKVTEILSPTVFVSTAEKISTILSKLQQKQAQVAVVLDEFGGTYGIVTMEDVLEELVGEIWDEMDNIVEPFQKIGDSVVRVDASAELEDFCKFFNVEIVSEMVSVSGWVMEAMQGLPRQGDVFNYENLEIRVLSVKRRCVSLLEVHIKDSEPKPPTEEA